METTFKMTAYHKWLLNLADKDRDILAYLIFADLYEQNPQTFDLMEAVGEDLFTRDAIFNCADFLLEQEIREDDKD